MNVSDSAASDTAEVTSERASSRVFVREQEEKTSNPTNKGATVNLAMPHRCPNPFPCCWPASFCTTALAMARIGDANQLKGSRAWDTIRPPYSARRVEMKTLRLLRLFSLTLTTLLLTSNIWSQAPQNCAAMPDHDKLRASLV